MPPATESPVNDKEYIVLPVEPNFIPSNGLKKAQILWVGCSSSWITETSVLDVASEEIFVHRNLGNILSYNDLSAKSAIEYSLHLLEVKHIIICGHYDCRLKKNESDGVDSWSSWSKDPSHQPNGQNGPRSPRTTEKEREEELHVLREVQWVRRQPQVAKAIQERGLEVHAFIYDKDCGRSVRIVGAGSD